VPGAQVPVTLVRGTQGWRWLLESARAGDPRAMFSAYLRLASRGGSARGGAGGGGGSGDGGGDGGGDGKIGGICGHDRGAGGNALGYGDGGDGRARGRGERVGVMGVEEVEGVEGGPGEEARLWLERAAEAGHAKVICCNPRLWALNPQPQTRSGPSPLSPTPNTLRPTPYALHPTP
jgi:TPR repeat protein